MLVESERLGPIEVDEGSVIEVPAGLIGFPQLRRFALVAAEDTGVYSWLQSLDDPTVSFLAVVPAAVFPDYEPTIGDEDCIAIGLSDPADAQLLCLVTATDDGVTANLLGPVLLDVRTRLGRQVVLTDTTFTTREPIPA
ncbi:flagellar assembly protein FliW [Dermatobacter hominis]|uniref:flagellar assembly protein FliW n=1 Tax=Dermatobacter hominis TaxID=2884263 RepID=UPI001D120E6E|nr:flagellar assembly protein FliW [Dermatobacter hominis]UDY37198.1 flagellar assembly protein FliW [Dermatobacter hominis]